MQPLLNGIERYLPNPTEINNIALDRSNDEEEVPLKTDHDAPLVALAFKLEEGQFGQLTYLRVYQGVLKKGAAMANHELLYLGISGDGDSASIGIGQFIHCARRQLNMTYIVENNGTYGLTKGQFSATNDLESKSKYGDDNLFPSIDLPSMAIQLGASFVARSFSGDKEQLVPLLKAALSHKGFSFLDIISPCVTFNNHNTSTKSYDYIREHNDALSKPDFVPSGKEILTDYPKGSTVDVPLHDGSLLSLEKISENYDPADKIKAIQNIQESQRDGKVLTGLLYADPEAKDLKEILNVSDKPLNEMDLNDLCPGSEKLKDINSGLK